MFEIAWTSNIKLKHAKEVRPLCRKSTTSTASQLTGDSEGKDWSELYPYTFISFQVSYSTLEFIHCLVFTFFPSHLIFGRHNVVSFLELRANTAEKSRRRSNRIIARTGPSSAAACDVSHLDKVLTSRKTLRSRDIAPLHYRSRESTRISNFPLYRRQTRARPSRVGHLTRSRLDTRDRVVSANDW